jgi:hypothetical protein
MNAWSLAPRVILSRWRIGTASNPLEHLHMIRAVLRVPKQLSGCVAECGANKCGAYKGGSAANLFLVCSRIRENCTPSILSAGCLYQRLRS